MPSTCFIFGVEIAAWEVWGITLVSYLIKDTRDDLISELDLIIWVITGWCDVYFHSQNEGIPAALVVIGFDKNCYSDNFQFEQYDKIDSFRLSFVKLPADVTNKFDFNFGVADPCQLLIETQPKILFLNILFQKVFIWPHFHVLWCISSEIICLTHWGWVTHIYMSVF